MKFKSAEHSFKVLHLQGTPYEMGFQHGQFLRYEIAYAISHCLGKWGIEFHQWNKNDIINYANKAFSLANPRIQEEFEGMASGSGLPLEDILAWNYIDDYYELYQCTAFAANNRMTVDGEMIVGRNNDYEDDLSNCIAVSIIRSPKNGITSLCNTWAGTLGTYEGMNIKGLTTATQFSDTKDKNTFGKSIKQVNLEFLENCTTVAEASSYVANTSRNFGSNILVADINTMQVLECSGLDMAIRHKSNDHIVATNHFCELVPSVPQNLNSFLTKERKQFVTDKLIKNIGVLDVARTQAILNKSPIGRAGHRDYYTTRCAIYQPKKQIAHIAHGLLPAFKGPYIQIDLTTMVNSEAQLIHYDFNRNV